MTYLARCRVCDGLGLIEHVGDVVGAVLEPLQPQPHRLPVNGLPLRVAEQRLHGLERHLHLLQVTLEVPLQQDLVTDGGAHLLRGQPEDSRGEHPSDFRHGDPTPPYSRLSASQSSSRLPNKPSGYGGQLSTRLVNGELNHQPLEAEKLNYLPLLNVTINYLLLDPYVIDTYRPIYH